MDSYEKLRNVPTAIREWIGSEEVVDIIVDIEEKFGLDPEELTIPDAIFDVQVKDLPMERFVDDLTYGLEVSDSVARQIYDDVKRRIFQPIAPELLAWGVGKGELEAQTTEAPRAPFQPASFPAPAAPAPSTPVTFASQISSQTVQIPQRSVAPAAQPAQAPVSLYRDTLSSQAAVAAPRLGSIGGRIGNGDLSGSVSAAPQQARPARVDLGMSSSMRVDDTLKSIFVQRETPKVQAIDYGAARMPAPSIPTAPVPLSAAPVPAPAAEPFTPRVEVVSVPTRPEADQAAPGGIVDSLMRRVAPWHYAKFGNRTGAADTTPLPSKSVNYSADPAPTAAPQPAGALPIDDLPAPPPSQA